MYKYGRMTKEAIERLGEDDAFTLAGALAYYAVLSLAPVLILLVAIAGFVYGSQAAKGELARQIESWAGADAAQAIQTIIGNASSAGGGVLATVTSIFLVLLGASAVFGQLQLSLNRIWGVKLDPDEGIMTTVRQRLVGLAVAFGLGLLVVATVVVGAIMTNLQSLFGAVPVGEWFWVLLNIGVSVGVLTLVFALLFKYVPEVDISWDDVWIGSAITAIMFTVGKSVLSLYLGSAAIGSAYGAASSGIVLLVWLFYSALILFLAAEFTQVYAERAGRMIEPGEHAVRISSPVG